MLADEWISARDAAKILGISAQTVRRSLADPDRRVREWGQRGEGWRLKPLSQRDEYQLRRTWVAAKASGES